MKDGNSVEQHQRLLAAAGSDHDRRRDSEEDDHSPVGCVVPVRPPQPPREYSDAASAVGERLQQPGPGLERRAGCGQQQHRGRQLKGSKEHAAPGSGARDLGDLSRVGPWDPDPQVEGESRQPEGEHDHDREQPERDPTKPAPTSLVELAQLRDRRRGRFHAGGERHPTGKASNTPNGPRCWRPGGASGAELCATGARKPRATITTATATNAIVIAAKIERPPAQPAQAGDDDKQAERKQNPQRSQPRQVGDDRRSAGGDADRCDRAMMPPSGSLFRLLSSTSSKHLPGESA